MALLVDRAFFLSMGEMQQVEHLSNCDVVWFRADIAREPGEDRYRLEIVDECAVKQNENALGRIS